MPVVIRLTFPGGRYHATPWGRHVNEGVPEWPPSPWRLLRALVAVWKRTCPEFPSEQVRRVLTPLCHPPSFLLPPHTVAHTRHAMPMNIIQSKYRPSVSERKAGKFQGDPSIVFDTFVAVNRKDDLIVGWPEATLEGEDAKCLAALIGNLTSLGRAEGWVEGQLLPSTTSLPQWNCVPTEHAPNPVRVFCPDPATAFESKHYPKVNSKTKPEKRLFDCPPWHLCLDTETIHAEKWSSVPGSKWVNYARPVDGNKTPAKPKRTPHAKPTVARFMLDGPVLPIVTDTVIVAEAFRRAVMGRFRYWCEDHPKEAELFRRKDKPELFSSRTLSGKELNGEMRKDHGHAYYLPSAEGDDRRRMTHITVTANDGFGPGEVGAFNSLRKLCVGDSERGLALRVQLVGLGQESDFQSWMFTKSRVWESVTPFVVHRHFKRRGTKRDQFAPEADWKSEFIKTAALECLQREGWEQPVNVELFGRQTPEGLPPAISFRRKRHRDLDLAARPFEFVRITFSKPVARPQNFGYACHYGLGLLQPRLEKTFWG